MSPLPDSLPQAEEAVAGRSCPLDYTYAPRAFARGPDFSANVLYVAGGLYGNIDALDAIETLVAAEPAVLVFNGDFHWLDAEPVWFAAVERRARRHRATRGNVETEIGRAQDIGAGCGCAYRDSVSEDVVRRSNEIMAILRASIPAAARAPLYSLPTHYVACVGQLRVGIVHGDAHSVAGWDFAHDALDAPDARGALNETARAAKVDVFASTHTGLPALRDFALPSGRLTIINNGGAGLPNFSATHFGVVTRIATAPSPHRPLYGIERNGVHIDAIAVPYDNAAFLERLRKRWPQGSPAYTSYYTRIVDGPDYTVAQAKPR